MFGTQSFTNVTTTFATSAAGPFISSPPAGGNTAADYKYVQVSASVNVPMLLMGAAIGQRWATVAGQATVGEILLTGMTGGEFPFSPYSRKNKSPDDATDPFGFKVGNDYTLRWSPPGDKSSCDGGADEAAGVASNGSFRGYCCTGAQSAVARRDILAGNGNGTVPMNVGDDFSQYTVNGQKNSISIQDWVNMDTDTSSADYAAYKSRGAGNLKRVVTVPVNDLNGTGKLVGFATFFF